MPYKIAKSGSGFKVQNKHSGKTYSKKPMSKAKAKRQMAAMYANSDEDIHESFAQIIDSLLNEDGYQHIPRRFIEPPPHPEVTQRHIKPHQRTRRLPVQPEQQFINLLNKATNKQYTALDVQKHGIAKLLKHSVDDMTFMHFLTQNPLLMRREVLPKIPATSRVEILYSWIKGQIDG